MIFLELFMSTVATYVSFQIHLVSELISLHMTAWGCSSLPSLSLLHLLSSPPPTAFWREAH